MKLDVLSIFPGYFDSPLRVGLLGKAIEAGAIDVGVHDLRDWADDPHRKVDDEPYGGGAGMVMAPGPIVAAAESLAPPGARVVLLSAAGRAFDQAVASELAAESHILLVCGRYEGIDERVSAVLSADELSVGEFVLAGGEAAALVVIEAISRLQAGFVGNEESLAEESFSSELLEYPHYTRPQVFREISVPDVLVSGNHRRIARWRREQSLRRTFERRPWLLERARLTEEERALIEGWKKARSS